MAVPAEREVAAVMLQPGQKVRVLGRWQTVRGVRGECASAGGVVVVLGLDEGPVPRMGATEPLTVRDGATANADAHNR